jgi:RNA polymerase sigma factor for flagellar operon FliA
MLTSSASPCHDISPGEAMARDPSSSAKRRSLDRLVARHMTMVKRIAYELIANLPPSIDVNDLIQIGMLGLLEAADRFRTRADSSFATFATYRVRGAMIDALRQLQWTPRTVTRNLRRIGRVDAEIERPNGETSTAARVARALDMPVSTYHQTLWDALQGSTVSLDATGRSGEGFAIPEPVDRSPRPDESLEREQSLRLLAAAIERLPDAERTILLLYYDEEMLLREIGETLELTESRICQIQKKTLQKLRASVLRDAECRDAQAGHSYHSNHLSVDQPNRRGDWRHRALPRAPQTDRARNKHIAGDAE